MLLEVLDKRFAKTTINTQLTPTMFYFSAHWCPPCRHFTPLLKSFADCCSRDSQPIQIVFVSSDRSEADMRQYFTEAHGNWFVLPYDSMERNSLKARYDIKGIPSLILSDVTTGDACSLDVRTSIYGMERSGFSAAASSQLVAQIWGASGGFALNEMRASLTKFPLDASSMRAAMELLSDILWKIASNPSEPKYRQIRADSAKLNDKLTGKPCGDGPLKAVGFALDSVARMYVFSPGAKDLQASLNITRQWETHFKSLTSPSGPVLDDNLSGCKLSPVIDGQGNPLEALELDGVHSIEMLCALVESCATDDSEAARVSSMVVETRKIDGSLAESIQIYPADESPELLHKVASSLKKAPFKKGVVKVSHV